MSFNKLARGSRYDAHDDVHDGVSFGCDVDDDDDSVGSKIKSKDNDTGLQKGLLPSI